MSATSAVRLSPSYLFAAGKTSKQIMYRAFLDALESAIIPSLAYSPRVGG